AAYTRFHYTSLSICCDAPSTSDTYTLSLHDALPIAVDENVGRVLDYLDENELSENTVVVYTSDQGFYLGEHGWFDKRFMYNESFKTPLLIRWPNVITPATTEDEMVQNLDFAQTFLEMAGLVPPSDMQGESFLPL